MLKSSESPNTIQTVWLRASYIIGCLAALQNFSDRFPQAGFRLDAVGNGRVAAGLTAVARVTDGEFLSGWLEDVLRF